MSKKALLCVVVTGAILVLLSLAVPVRTPAPALKFWGARFMPDGKTLVTVGSQSPPREQPFPGELIFWDAASGQKQHSLQQRWGIRSLDMSRDGQWVAIGDFGGATKLVEPASGKILATWLSQVGPVNAVAISADGKWVATCGTRDKIVLWDVEAHRQQKPLWLRRQEILNVAISPTGSVLAASSHAGKAYLFDLRQPDEPPTVLAACEGNTAQWASVEALAFAPDGLTLATGGGTTLRLWETKSGKLIRDFKESPDKAGGAAASGKATTAAKAKPNAARLLSVAFSGDGATLAAVDTAGMLALWKVETGERLKAVRAHTGPCYSVCFSPDSKHIVTVGRTDYSACIWDATTLERIAAFNRTARATQSVSQASVSAP